MSSQTNVSSDLPVMDGARFAIVTNDDHTGIIWVVTILSFIYTLMIFGLRLEARRNNFGLDDALAIIGTLVTSIQYVLIFLANNHGLGKSYRLISTSDATAVGKYMLASQVLTLLALGLAKGSVVFLCRRLFTVHRASHRIICDIALGVCGLWSVASVLAVTIGCGPVSLLGYDATFCGDLVTRWIGVGVFDCITEVLIVAMAVDGLFPLQMSVSRKVQALATFAPRLILIVFATLHMTSLQDTKESTNPGVAMATPTLYLQIELLYALFSASIPALNRWLRNFDTSMGSTWIHSSHAFSHNQSEKSQERSRSRSVPLVDLNGSQSNTENKRDSTRQKRVSKTTNLGTRSSGLIPAGPKYTVKTETYAPDARGKFAIRRMDSEEMIIRKEVEWQVQHEEADSMSRTSS